MSEADDLRRAVAIHEAGHFIVARDFGLAVLEVEIGIDGDPTNGVTQTDCPAQLSFIKQLALCVAGTVAQEMFNAHARIGQGDACRLAALLDGLPQVQAKRLYDAARARARRILKLNKVDIERLAERLVRDGRITLSWPKDTMSGGHPNVSLHLLRF